MHIYIYIYIYGGGQERERVGKREEQIEIYRLK